MSEMSRQRGGLKAAFLGLSLEQSVSRNGDSTILMQKDNRVPLAIAAISPLVARSHARSYV